MMRSTLMIALVLLLAAAGAGHAQDAKTWQPVTVTTSDGWNLPDCSLQWVNGGRTARVTRPDGTWRDFEPWMVKRVTLADGTDITAEIAAARPKGAADADPAPPAEAYNDVGAASPPPATYVGLAESPDQRPPFGVLGTAGVGYGLFMGDWYEGFENSMSFHGDVRIGTGGRQWLALGFRRQQGGTETGYVDLTGLGDYSEIEASVDVNAYRLAAGGVIGQRSPGGGFAYLEAGLVVLQHKLGVWVQNYGSESVSETRLGAQLAVGGIIPVGGNFVIDVCADCLVKSSIFNSDESSGMIVGIHAGLGVASW